MARRIGYFSSGVYDTETDLTIITRAIGSFSAGIVGLMEKGPAFEIIPTSTFEEYTEWFGPLNPDYFTSYFSKQYHEQSANLKSVRILGLEGYTDTKAFVIAYDVAGVTATTMSGDDIVTPFIAPEYAIACVLKPRPTVFTGLPEITSIVIGTWLDPDTNVAAATDYRFELEITYADATTETVICSLRPGEKEYLPNIFGSNPRSRHLFKGNASPLWVEFIIPSVERKLEAVPSNITPVAYYYPGDNIPLNQLNINTGETIIKTDFAYPTIAIAGMTNASPIVVETAVAHGLSTGMQVVITNVAATTAANGIHWITVIDSTHFSLFSNEARTTPVVGNGVFAPGSETLSRYWLATWERELLDFDEIQYQTPVTPWFVSDVDINQQVKKLFRLWSISDGEAANTQIKAEIRNIDPSGFNGIGTFDIVIKSFELKEDRGRNSTGEILETWNNLTLDPTNDNYALKRIGDGELYPLSSRFIFIEMNENEEIEAGLLPYGVEGYPISTGLVMPDITWTTEYDMSVSLSRQTLGLANNSVNMFQAVTPDQLVYRNTAASNTGKGFHLNELADTSVFVVAPIEPANQEDSLGDPIPQFVSNPALNKSRLKFTVCFYGGFDGFNVYNERTWGTSGTKDYDAFKQAIDLFDDKESLFADITVLTTPDINIDLHESAVEYTLDMVERRGDVLLLMDLAYDLEALPEAAVASLDSTNLRSSYNAIYHPWVQFNDTINKVNKWVPPSLMALSTIAYVAEQEDIWQPPAGMLRTVTRDILRTRRRMKLEDREVLKAANINPITNFPGSGIEITETRTTQEYFSALSFIHNRLLLCFAKKALNQTLRPLLHQLNNNITRESFINAVTPIFDRIKKRYGIEEFTVDIQDVPNDKVTIYGRICIVPLYPVERIIVDYVLKDNSFDFTPRG